MKNVFLLSAVLLAGLAPRSFGDWRNLTTADGLPGNEVQFISQDDDGTIWVGTLSGLAKYSDGKFTTFVEGTGVWDVLKTGPGKYLIGAQSGTLTVDGEQRAWAHKGMTVAPIHRYGEKAIWIIGKSHGTEVSTLLQSTGGTWSAIAYFENRRVVDLFRTSNGHMWVVCDGNGVFEVDPAKGPEQAVHHLQALNVTTMAEDSRHRVWFGLWGRGVRVLEDGRWLSYVADEDSSVFSIVEDTKGGIWVATSAHGLWHYDGNEWVNRLRDEGGVNMLSKTSDGKVWISTQTHGGLRYWDGKDWKVSLDSTLPIRCLLEAKNGELWAGGILDGLHILKKQ